MVRRAVTGGLLAERPGCGTIRCAPCSLGMMSRQQAGGGTPMHGIIYLVGLIVVILAILSFFGLR